MVIAELILAIVRLMLRFTSTQSHDFYFALEKELIENHRSILLSPRFSFRPMGSDSYIEGAYGCGEWRCADEAPKPVPSRPHSINGHNCVIQFVLIVILIKLFGDIIL